MTYVKINLRVILIIISTLTFSSCTEKIHYTGKVLNLNEDIYNLNTKQETINYLGDPNYIDPIEKKHFYFSETKITKNFFDNKIIDRKLIVFHFNSNDTIKSIDEYYLDDQNKIKLIEDQTPGNIIKQGILESIFGGIGKGPITTP